MRNFFANLKTYLRPADKNCCSCFLYRSFMHHKFDMRLLQGNGNICDFQFFFQKQRQQKRYFISAIKSWQFLNAQATWKLNFALFLLANKIALLFRAQIKFCAVASCATTCATLFMVKLAKRKFLWRFDVSKQNSAVRFSQIEPELFSYLATGKAPLKACAFSHAIEKQKMLSWTRWYK